MRWYKSDATQLTHILTHTGSARSGLGRFQWIYDRPVFREKRQKTLETQGKIGFLAAHNPEVVGSSPASATIKSPEILRFQDFFLLFRGKKLEVKFCDFVENRLTHILTHNRIAPSGQVWIFQNTMSTKSENPRNFQNFLKRIFLRPPGFSLDVQNLSQRQSPAPGEVYLFISFCQVSPDGIMNYCQAISLEIDIAY